MKTFIASSVSFSDINAVSRISTAGYRLTTVNENMPPPDNCLIEEDLLFASLGAMVRGSQVGGFASQSDPGAIDRIASMHGMEPFLFHWWGRDENVPRELREKWKKAAMSVLLANERGLKASLKILQFLDGEDIKAVAMRGITLAFSLYPEPYLRPMQDVDILVERNAAGKIETALTKQGLEPVKRLRSQLVYNVDGVEVEVHWSFFTPKRYNRSGDFDEWSFRTRNLTTNYGVMKALPAERELIGLVCHSFVHHEMSGLQSLFDAALFMTSQTPDWQYVRQWCKRFGFSGMFEFFVAYIDRLFEVDLMRDAGFSGKTLPAHAEKVFDAYSSALKNRDAAKYFLRRKANLMRVAEGPLRKLKQFIRFFGKRDRSEFRMALLERDRFAASRKHFAVEKKVRAHDE